MTGTEYRLCDVALDCSFRTRDARVEREQALAIVELLESNTFTPIGHDGGPYRLKIETADGRLALHVTDDNGVHVVSHYLSLTPFRRLLKDYTRICESYYDAMCRPGPERLEAIDIGSLWHPQRSGRAVERASLQQSQHRQGHGASPVHADVRATRTQCRTSDSLKLNSYQIAAP